VGNTNPPLPILTARIAHTPTLLTFAADGCGGVRLPPLGSPRLVAPGGGSRHGLGLAPSFARRRPVCGGVGRGGGDDPGRCVPRASFRGGGGAARLWESAATQRRRSVAAQLWESAATQRRRSVAVATAAAVAAGGDGAGVGPRCGHCGVFGHVSNSAACPLGLRCTHWRGQCDHIETEKNAADFASLWCLEVCGHCSRAARWAVIRHGSVRLRRVGFAVPATSLIEQTVALGTRRARVCCAPPTTRRRGRLRWWRPQCRDDAAVVCDRCARSMTTSSRRTPTRTCTAASAVQRRVGDGGGGGAGGVGGRGGDGGWGRGVLGGGGRAVGEEDDGLRTV
jgi:hypothetical protein